MNRIELQSLAEERISDAQILLDAGRWSSAYYLAGYAVECGLKSCIAKLTNQHDFPDKNFAVKIFSHKIETLVEAAGLKDQRDTDRKANPTQGAYWQIVKDWAEEARYQKWSEADARKLFNAITDPANGVLPWIMDRW